MKNIFSKKNKQSGYAILFTVIVISAISVIAAGLSSSAYKQLILSSLARDSQMAFYQSDLATECALYADWVKSVQDPNFFKTSENRWKCGNRDLKVTYIDKGGGNYFYTLLPTDVDSYHSKSCFQITVEKNIVVEEGLPIEKTTIFAKGYNICDLDNPRTVEREIEINY